MVFVVGRSNDATASWTKYDRYIAENIARGVIIWSRTFVVLVIIRAVSYSLFILCSAQISGQIVCSTYSPESYGKNYTDCEYLII